MLLVALTTDVVVTTLLAAAALNDAERDALVASDVDASVDNDAVTVLNDADWLRLSLAAATKEALRLADCSASVETDWEYAVLALWLAATCVDVLWEASTLADALWEALSSSDWERLWDTDALTTADVDASVLKLVDAAFDTLVTYEIDALVSSP